MKMRNLADELLQEAVSRPAAEVDLASAALLIALDEYPNLNPKEYLFRIDQFATEIRQLLHFPVWERPVEAIEKLNHYLFEVEGFRGNQENYYDPRNSFLNEVLDRKAGIPITLSVVYMEVGKRLGLQLEGVGMPGHFLLKCMHHGLEIFVDPFGQGEILLERDCEKKLRKIYGSNFQFEPSHLNSVNSHQILTRMLTNLKAIYFKNHDYFKTLAIIEKILIVNPNSPHEFRDRGWVHYKLERFDLALRDWSHYIKLDPNAPDTEEIKKHLTAVRHRLASRN